LEEDLDLSSDRLLDDDDDVDYCVFIIVVSDMNIYTLKTLEAFGGGKILDIVFCFVI